jgi:hypothetical protein
MSSEKLGRLPAFHRAEGVGILEALTMRGWRQIAKGRAIPEWSLVERECDEMARHRAAFTESVRQAALRKVVE